MTDSPGAGAALAATPGATLASAREASGLTVADVAGQMRISPRQVQAIEADQYGQLPGAVFVRGFVRNYARLLQLDPAPLLHALEPELGQDVPLRAHEISGTLPVPARRSHSRVWITAFVVVFAMVVAAGVYELWRSRSERAGVAGVRSVQAPTPPAPLAAPPGGVSSGAVGTVDSLQPAPESAAHGGDATAALAPAANAPEAVAAEQPQSSGANAPHEARVQLQFDEESWVEVRERNGRVVFSGTGQAKTTRSLVAAAPLDVVVGNAAGVRITYNDQPFDVAAHAARNIARFTLE